MWLGGVGCGLVWLGVVRCGCNSSGDCACGWLLWFDFVVVFGTVCRKARCFYGYNKGIVWLLW